MGLTTTKSKSFKKIISLGFPHRNVLSSCNALFFYGEISNYFGFCLLGDFTHSFDDPLPLQCPHREITVQVSRIIEELYTQYVAKAASEFAIHVYSYQAME